MANVCRRAEHSNGGTTSDRHGLLITASASRRHVRSRLIARPARTPVSASSLPFRALTRGSGPVWAANRLPS